MSDKDVKDLKNIVLTTLEDIIANGGEPSITKRRKVSTRKRNNSNITQIKNPELKYYDEEEKKFYNKLDDEKKNFIAGLEILMNDMNKNDIPIRFKILFSKIDDSVKAIAIKKLRYLYDIDTSSTEYYKITNWIELLCKLPIGKYISLPIDNNSSVNDIRDFIRNIKQKLDDKVYGHRDAKDHIIRLIAQWISNPNSKGMIIGIHGSPGTGKTHLVRRGICEALGLPFAFLSLGGASDGSFLEGHSYTYEGSTHGRICDILMKAGCMNPVLYFDELDKVSTSYRGEEVSNILIHLTDHTQNDKFADRYFTDIEFDLSRCLMIFSYNDPELVNPILKDRMIKIHTDGYKIDDKLVIAKDFLLPDICSQFKIKPNDIVLKDEQMKYIINNKIEMEDGVRNLKRALECIVSNLNLNLLMSPEENQLPIEITETVINTFVKSPKELINNKHAMMYL